MKKKKLTYMLAVTSDYVFAAGNIVLSLIKQRPTKDFDVTIFYENISDNDRKILEDTGICNLIKYQLPEGFEEYIRTNCPKFNDAQYAKHFSFLKFAKFEIFTLLDKYENAVWLDADIAVQCDPYEIIEYQPFAITIDRDWTVSNNFTMPIDGYDMAKQGCCSAVFLVSDKLKEYQKMKDWCYNFSKKVCQYFKNIDQGIFNLLLQEFNVDYQLLPLDDYQCFTYRDNGAVAKIVHFGTANKIWNNTLIISSFPEWYRIHREWLKLGGGDFNHSPDFTCANVYGKLQYRDKKIKELESKVKNFEIALSVIKSTEIPVEESYKIKFLGIPVFHKKIKGNKVKYYLFNFLHFLTITTK